MSKLCILYSTINIASSQFRVTEGKMSKIFSNKGKQHQLGIVSVNCVELNLDNCNFRQTIGALCSVCGRQSNYFRPLTPHVPMTHAFSTSGQGLMRSDVVTHLTMSNQL